MVSDNFQKNNNGVIDKFLSVIDGDNKIILADKLLDNKILSVLNDQELINSALAFFDNNLNISETSRNTFMHRNTLIYRIDKIEKLTGLNLRNLKDAVSFLLMKTLYDRIKNIR